MNKLLQKLKDLNSLSNLLPLYLIIEDDGSGSLMTSLDERLISFDDLDELDLTLNKLIDEYAEEKGL